MLIIHWSSLVSGRSPPKKIDRPVIPTITVPLLSSLPSPCVTSDGDRIGGAPSRVRRSTCRASPSTRGWRASWGVACSPCSLPCSPPRGRASTSALPPPPPSPTEPPPPPPPTTPTPTTAGRARCGRSGTRWRRGSSRSWCRPTPSACPAPRHRPRSHPSRSVRLNCPRSHPSRSVHPRSHPNRSGCN